MRNKVLYISIILLIALLNSGYSQKVSLILLPSGSMEIQTYDINAEEIEQQEIKEGISTLGEDIQLTPQKNERRQEANTKSLEIKKQRLCKIIGSFCLKKWSKGLIKLFSLPSAPGIKI